MQVKHKVSGKVFEVSDDYFKQYEDRLETLEEVKTKPKKSTRKTKVIEETTEE